VIGLIWGAYTTPGHALYGYGIACPIGAVLSATTGLNIYVPVGGLNTTDMPFHTLPPEQIVGDLTEASQEVTLLRERLSQTKQGQAVLDLINSHRTEIMSLINHNRAVTVMWHRKQGPAFAAALSRSAKHPEYAVPKEIEGITRQLLCMSMAVILQEHGSEKLRSALRQCALPLLNLIDRYDRVHEIVDALEAQTLPELASLTHH
jgi:hypothetical protein